MIILFMLIRMQAAATVPCIFFVYCRRHHLTNHGQNHIVAAVLTIRTMIAMMVNFILSLMITVLIIILKYVNYQHK